MCVFYAYLPIVRFWQTYPNCTILTLNFLQPKNSKISAEFQRKCDFSQIRTTIDFVTAASFLHSIKLYAALNSVFRTAEWHLPLGLKALCFSFNRIQSDPNQLPFFLVLKYSNSPFNESDNLILIAQLLGKKSKTGKEVNWDYCCPRTQIDYNYSLVRALKRIEYI